MPELLNIQTSRRRRVCISRTVSVKHGWYCFSVLCVLHNNSFSLTDVSDDPTVATCTFDPQWIMLCLTDNITHLGTTPLSHIDWACMMDYMLDFDRLETNWLPHKQKNTVLAKTRQHTLTHCCGSLQGEVVFFRSICLWSPWFYLKCHSVFYHSVFLMSVIFWAHLCNFYLVIICYGGNDVLSSP